MINGSSEWKSFQESTIWKDICEEFDIWLEEIRDQLESDGVDLGLVKSLRGSALAIRNAKRLPENLQIAAEELEQNSAKKREEEDE